MEVVGLSTMIVVAAACHQQSRLPLPAPGRLQLMLTPASFGDPVNLRQQIKVTAPTRTDNLDAILEISPDAVTLVGMSFGLRVLTMRYDGVTFTEQRHPMVPAEVRGADILTDVQLALWPVAAVQAALPPGWMLRDEGARRTLSQNDRAVVVITYEGARRWEGRLTLENRQYNYQLVITSAVIAP